MNRQQMNSILKELEEQISSGNLDDYHQQKTQAFAEKIQHKLKDGDDILSADEFFMKQIEESIDQFEVNHPKLTEIIGRISDLLSRSGI